MRSSSFSVIETRGMLTVPNSSACFTTVTEGAVLLLASDCFAVRAFGFSSVDVIWGGGVFEAALSCSSTVQPHQ